MLWSLLFKSFMHPDGTESLEILKAIVGYSTCARERSASNPSNYLQLL
ncbi:hypothetical protein Gotri_026333 [Gossypium trilobum]|uniref:Uncharacterized protein n=1 Tax=Gossypium trilobum TaxID=34281 RepID=A0A7J9FI78_9ROSI|nr:hypothetical protein [Gossypium trilobum]